MYAFWDTDYLVLPFTMFTCIFYHLNVTDMPWFSGTESFIIDFLQSHIMRCDYLRYSTYYVFLVLQQIDDIIASPLISQCETRSCHWRSSVLMSIPRPSIMYTLRITNRLLAKKWSTWTSDGKEGEGKGCRSTRFQFLLNGPLYPSWVRSPPVLQRLR